MTIGNRRFCYKIISQIRTRSIRPRENLILVWFATQYIYKERINFSCFVFIHIYIYIYKNDYKNTGVKYLMKWNNIVTPYYVCVSHQKRLVLCLLLKIINYQWVLLLSIFDLRLQLSLVILYIYSIYYIYFLYILSTIFIIFPILYLYIREVNKSRV